ncbi:MAG: hypothetical protein KJ954_13905, partial [Alphaproteobacteria bacterium]|nr:hypothetical protein [Alphaproteobacteria bacterium]
AVPVRREVQNDADTWHAVLANVNGDGKDVRMLKKMKAQLRPFLRDAEKVEECKRKQVGVLTISEEGLRFLKGLIDKPPEVQTQRGAVKFQFTGSMQETVADFLDFYETRPDQKKAEPEQPE